MGVRKRILKLIFFLTAQGQEITNQVASAHNAPSTLNLVKALTEIKKNLKTFGVFMEGQRESMVKMQKFVEENCSLHGGRVHAVLIEEGGHSFIASSAGGAGDAANSRDKRLKNALIE